MNFTEEVINPMEEKKPVKSKRLKIISHIGSIYATFDGKQIWEIDRGLSYILGLCDGTRTSDQIADEIAREININVDDAKFTLSNILKEFESKGFIEYL